MYGYGYSLYNRTPFLGTSGVDPAASAYFAATGITGVTQQTAINNLVKGLKTDGIWSKMKAVYPFVTDNKNRLGYTEDFSNALWQKVGATVTANNILAPDGTMTADRVVFGAANNYIYQQTSIVNVTANKSIYIKGTAGETISLDDTWAFQPLITLTGNWQRVDFTSTTTAVQGQGFAIGTSQSATARTIYIWGAQLELGSTATTYQPIATTQQAYIASQFKYNLVNPVDSDAAFRLVFNGGWTHSSNGATPNGVNAYADTKLVPSSVLALNSCSFSVYSRNNFTSGTVQSFGVTSDAAYQPLIGSSFLTSKGFNSYMYSSNPPDILLSPIGQNLAAMFLNTRTSATNAKSFRNTTQLALVTTQGQITQPTTSFTFGAFRNLTSFQDYNTFQHAFAHISDGLTDTEASNLYTRVQAYQTALSRQV
jgi:hypothetical protein